MSLLLTLGSFFDLKAEQVQALWASRVPTMAFFFFFLAPEITGTFSLAFEKGRIGEVRNYTGTEKKILFKIIVESVLFKWPVSLHV